MLVTLNRLLATISKVPIGAEAQLRLRWYTVFLLLGLPLVFFFNIQSLIRGEYVLSSFIVVAALGLSAGWYALRRMESGLVIYRINAFLYGTLLLKMVTDGGAGGSKILWAFTFPLIVLFLIGKREGFLWSGGMLLLAVALMVGAVPWMTVYPYPPDFKIRFFLTYSIVAAIAFMFEHYRETYRGDIEKKCFELEIERTRLEQEIIERQKLSCEREAALAQVRVLRGLLPICSSCKKIRDEQGEWTHLESYIDARSEAKFTHGICPDCARKLYPSCF